VAAAVERAVEELAGSGAEVVDVELRRPALASAVSLVVLLAEAAEVWGDELDRAPRGFGAPVRAALAVGRQIPAADLRAARRAGRLLRNALNELLQQHRLDGLLMPTVAATAALAGSATVAVGGRRVPVETANSRFTALASVTGHPALSVPCGLDDDGLPIGLQAIGRPRGEALLLRIAAAVETFEGAQLTAAARRRARLPSTERTA
jgi:Asp-tRNA(Asn)/Glu-tRNA(Gln) amidotransferase A subunit family amidase